MTQLVESPLMGLPARLEMSHGSGRQWRERWNDARPRVRTGAKLATLLGAIVCAYGYSLTSLVQTATMQTPLAYISLVPIIALTIAAMHGSPTRVEPPIHDRQLDYIIGLPLMGIAIAINLVLPGRFSAMFWVWRIDLLSLPLFVAGSVAVIFGVRVVWRQKLAIGYLFLAWPWPYTTVLLRVLNASTSATLAGLRLVLRVIPVAEPVPGGDGSVFEVVHQGHSFPVSVVSACSGINGIVGFLLVGVAFSAIVRGPRIRKGLWLASGMVLLWLFNLGRLAFIFWAGRQWGENVAINVLHPFVGLLTFSAGVLVMLVVMRPLGMSIGPPVDSRIAGEARREKTRGTGPLAVPRAFGALTIVVVAAIILGFADNGLREYDLVANAAGEPKLLSFHAAPATPAGWQLRVSETIDWAKPLFGDDSTWTRYLFIPTGGGDLHSAYGITADVIDTSDEGTFSAYGVEACYQFHGWLLRDVAQVNVGGGITGQTLSFSASDRQSWSVLYWIVPVKMGQDTRYERFVLYLLNAPGGTHVQLPRGIRITNLAGSIADTGANAVLAENRAFLIAFAHQLILQQAQHASVMAPHVAAATPTTAGTAATTGSADRSEFGNSRSRTTYPS